MRTVIKYIYMFLQYFPSTINSMRKKRIISGFLSNRSSFSKSFFKIRIRNNHKFLTSKNLIFKLNLFKQIFLGSYLILTWIKITYSNTFYLFCFFGNKSINLKPAGYGFNFNKIYKHYFSSIFLNTLKKYHWRQKYKYQTDLMHYNFLMFFVQHSIFFFVRDYYSTLILAKSGGTFCRFLIFNKLSRTILLSLPSKHHRLFDLFVIGFCGRCSNIFHKYSYWASFKQKKKLKKHCSSVRGIAKNPIDHPNGGSSKTKQPLKNPWAKIAKCGK